MVEPAVEEALTGYEVGGELGRGAMGVVLSAHHVQLDRDVAIKQLPGSMAEDPDVRARFGIEARVLASLTHPHIVPVYDYMESEGLCLLVMQALPGGTVWSRFTGEGLTMQTSCSVLLATCAGLEHAHQRQVLHRDIKPENLMFDAENSLKVTDFGIAKVFGGDETLATLDGGVIGTPAYMAPEQAENLELGPPADVYAAGTVLYELLSGSLPFPEGDPVTMLEQRVVDDPVPLSEVSPQVPAPLNQVVMRSIERQPEDRYQSAEELGVAVGRAASESWGGDWLTRSDVALMASGTIASAARTTQPTDIPGVTDSAAASPESRRARATAAPGRAVAAVAVRADVSHHERGADVADIDRADLVAVDDILTPPAVPWAGIVASAALLLALLVVAFLGPGDPGRSVGLDVGQVTVNGQDVAADGPVSINLAEDIRVDVDDLPLEGGDATSVELRLSVLGIPAGTSTQGLLPRAGGGETTIGARSLRVLSNGDFTGELRFLDASGATVVTHQFTVEPDQPWYLTAAAVVGATLLLFVVAYGISALTPLWLGRRSPSAIVGMGVLGGVAALALVLWVWTLGGQEPSWPGSILAMALGAAAFSLGSWCVFRLRRRHRLAALHGDGPDDEPDDDGEGDEPPPSTPARQSSETIVAGGEHEPPADPPARRSSETVVNPGETP